MALGSSSSSPRRGVRSDAVSPGRAAAMLRPASLRTAGRRTSTRHAAPRRHYGPGKGGRLPGKPDKRTVEHKRVVRGDGMVVTSGPFQPSIIRAEFPVLAAIDRDPTDLRIFLDGPGGTQVHQSVVDAMSDALINKMSNIGYDYAASLNCLELVHDARANGATFFNCEGREVVYGPTMTSLAFQLAASIAQTLEPGDEIFLSRSEHEGNISPWLRMAELTGAKVRWIPLDPHTFTLRLDVLENMLANAKGNPRFLAVGAASNATGTIHDVRRIVAMAKDAGVDYTVVDAVHYAPHQLIDVRAWGCDFCLTSAYKWFGPHQSMMYGKKELLATLPTTKVRPATDELPTLDSYELSRWEMGTLPFETIAGQLAAVDYIASLGTRFGKLHNGVDNTIDKRVALSKGFEVIAAHEAALAQQFVSGLEAIPGIQLHGLDADDLGGPPGSRRCPTFSLSKAGCPPAYLSSLLSSQGLMATYGDFYAIEVAKTLGLSETGGMLRVGFMHYSTEEEVDATLAAIDAAVPI